MKFTVLGNWGAYPEANEACSGYLLQIEDKNILIDCGSGVLSSLANYIAFEDLDAVVISHYHADHMCDIYSLQYAIDILLKLKKRKKPLLIYGHNQSAVFEKLSYKDACQGKPISDEMEIENISFRFHETKHQEKCYAMRIEYQNKSMVYTADTGWEDSLVELASGADLLVCEASLFNHQEGLNDGHLTAGQAGRLANQSGVNSLMITHFPHQGSLSQLQEEAEQAYGKNVMRANKGVTIKI